MKGLSENWFAAALTIFGVLYIGSLFVGHYIEIKRHNLDVLVQIRLCAGADGISRDGKTQCANVAKQQAIPNDFYEKEGAGFD